MGQFSCLFDGSVPNNFAPRAHGFSVEVLSLLFAFGFMGTLLGLTGWAIYTKMPKPRFWWQVLVVAAAGMSFIAALPVAIVYGFEIGIDFPLVCMDREPAHIERLLNLGADPNEEGEFGTPIQLAVKGRNWEVAKLLLRRGANPDAQIDGRAVIRIAADAGRWDVVQAIKKAAAK